MKVSRIAFPLIAEKKAMPNATIGGRTVAPIAADLSAEVHFHSSRLNMRAAQLAAIASTIPGPANTNSSVMLYPDCVVETVHKSTVIAASTARPVHVKP